jgi:CYTH domain-containing protein
MALEIERKFLLMETPADLVDHPGTSIRQGYLSVSENAEVRLRDKGGRFFEAVRIGRGLVRKEFQVELDRPQFEALWPATEGQRLEKTRYRIEVGGHVLDVDVFGGRLTGLMVVEVEFGNQRDAVDFVPPTWFEREVTGDDRYANRSLAVNGKPE